MKMVKEHEQLIPSTNEFNGFQQFLSGMCEIKPPKKNKKKNVLRGQTCRL